MPRCLRATLALIHSYQHFPMRLMSGYARSSQITHEFLRVLRYQKNPAWLGSASMKLMLVCTSGGHFSTMRDMESFWSQHERVWVTDFKKDTSLLNDLNERVCWLPYQGPRDWKRFLMNLPRSLRVLLLERPDMVLSTGASIAVNFAILSKLLGIRFLYIESISRSDELSLSGKFIYPLADEFYVQWQELTEKYPRAIFRGTVA